MDRNSRPNRRAEDLPGSSPGGVRPAEALDEQPMPMPPRQPWRRHQVAWTDFVHMLPPEIRIHARTIYDTYRRLETGRHVHLPAFRLAVSHVDVALSRIILGIFFPDLFPPSRRGIVNQILSRLTATDLSSLLLNASQTAISCAICWEDYVESDVIIVLPCHSSHHFHRNCIRVRSFFFAHIVVLLSSADLIFILCRTGLKDRFLNLSHVRFAEPLCTQLIHAREIVFPSLQRDRIGGPALAILGGKLCICHVHKAVENCIKRILFINKGCNGPHPEMR
jgi:hypothetical protein